MIDLYFWTTPNGMKPLILFEETGLDHTIQLVNLFKGEQFSAAFTQISPNQKIPVIDDHDPEDGGKVSLFESGAILHYLAEKAGGFLPASHPARAEVLQWLYWQMAGLGPTLGQYLHFSADADESIPYAQGRFSREKERLYGVLDERLRNRNFIAGNYSIADIATYPWIRRLERDGPHLNGFIKLEHWYHAVSERPAVERAYARAGSIQASSTPAQGCKKILLCA